MATNPPTMNMNNFPMSLMLATISIPYLSNYNCRKISIRFNNEFKVFFTYV